MLCHRTDVDKLGLTESELSSGLAIQLSFTLNQLSRFRHELNGTAPLGDEEVIERTAQDHSTVTAQKYKITVRGITDSVAVKMEVSED